MSRPDRSNRDDRSAQRQRPIARARPRRKRRLLLLSVTGLLIGALAATSGYLLYDRFVDDGARRLPAKTLSKGGLTWKQHIEPKMATSVVAWGGQELRDIPGTNGTPLWEPDRGEPLKVLATTDQYHVGRYWHLVEGDRDGQPVMGYLPGDYLCSPIGASPNEFNNRADCK